MRNHYPTLMAASLGALLSSLAGCAIPAGKPAVQTNEVRVTYDASRRFQTIEGWGGGIPGWSEGDPDLLPRDAYHRHLPGLLDALTGDLGLNRFYLELYATHVEPANDNDDPFKPDLRQFHVAGLEAMVRTVIVPLRQRVEARGERFIFYVRCFAQGGRNGPRPNVLVENADEYAELALVVLRKLRELGIATDYWVLQNEPELTREWEPGRLGLFAARLGARMRAAGFATRIAGPETLAPDGVPKWLSAIANTPGALAALGMITYHSYDYDPTLGQSPRLEPRRAVAALASQLRLRVAQTEQGSGGRANPRRWDGTDFLLALDLAENLWADLTAANASAWELHTLFGRRDPQGRWGGGKYLMISPDLAAIERPVQYSTLRQFTRFVRPGAVRVATEAAPGTTRVRVAAFLSPEGKPVAVLFHRDTSPVSLRISGLPPGEYSIAITSRTEQGAERAVPPLGRGESLRLELPGEAILTLWMK